MLFYCDVLNNFLMKEEVLNIFLGNEKYYRVNNFIMKSIKVFFESERFVKCKLN